MDAATPLGGSSPGSEQGPTPSASPHSEPPLDVAPAPRVSGEAPQVAARLIGSL